MVALSAARVRYFKVLLLHVSEGVTRPCASVSTVFNLSVKTSCYNLRGSNTLLPAKPSVKSKVTFGDRAFAIAAPSLWNSLPSELRSITCLTSFKAHLKTFLFRHAYT